jgi:AcrR family transcriptional regulator
MTVHETADAAAVPRVQSRIERKRSRRIQQILTAAAELVGERGYDAVSLDDVADRLDVTKGSLYHYFPSKEELVGAAIETLGREILAQLEQTLDALEGTARQRLRGLLTEQAAIVVRDHPAAIRLFFLLREWPEPQHARIKELRRYHNDLFRVLLEEGVRSGEFAVADVSVTLQCMHAAINQAPTWTRRMSPPELEQAINTLIDTLMKLVGTPPPT